MVGSPSVDTSEELSSPNRESERINSTPPAKRSSTTNTATTINTAYLVRGFFGFSSGSSGLRGRLGRGVHRLLVRVLPQGADRWRGG